MKDDRIPLLGLGDPITWITGFARVMREIFGHVSRDRFRLAYLSRGWIGQGVRLGFPTYSAQDHDVYCADAYPLAAQDFGLPHILLTLTDPYQIGWLSHPGKSPLKTSRSEEFITRYRDQIRWIGHFPVDGEGMNGPPLWFDEFLNGPDFTVFMSEWGQDMMARFMKKPHRFISHAVSDAFRPLNRDKAKEELEKRFEDRMFELAIGTDNASPGYARARTFRFNRFVILSVMANRSRKYWPLVLAAFKKFIDSGIDAGLVGVCGDPHGITDDSWSLIDLAQRLGLRVAGIDDNPNVWLVGQIGSGRVEDDDVQFANLMAACDHTTMPTAGEGFGLPQLEAHACGLPCTVGKYSASIELAVHSREFILPRGFGYAGNNVVKRPVYSVGDLAEAFQYSYNNPNWRTEVGLAGVQQAEQRRWSKILPQWFELFEEAWQGGKTIQQEGG